MVLQIATLQEDDRHDWELLARGYKDFYKTPLADAAYEVAWNRLLRAEDVFAFGAKRDGRLLGITHYLFHTTTWAPTTCYLQDLFVDPSARGLGIARALIEKVAGSRARTWSAAPATGPPKSTTRPLVRSTTSYGADSTASSATTFRFDQKQQPRAELDLVVDLGRGSTRFQVRADRALESTRSTSPVRRSQSRGRQFKAKVSALPCSLSGEFGEYGSWRMLKKSTRTAGRPSAASDSSLREQIGRVEPGSS